MSERPHIPVLLDEVIRHLALKDGDVAVDGTFGAGGYAEAMLKAADVRVVAFDRDPAAIAGGAALNDRFRGRLTLVHAPFSDMVAACEALGVAALDAVVFDFGVSSMQLDQAARGFSFMRDGPLDMRMGREGRTAADLIADLSEDDLIRILRDYGEEKRARRIAAALVARRSAAPLTRTGELARLVEETVGVSKTGVHAATKTFQALRIAVNDELGEIERGLVAAEAMLNEGGRLVAVSFHSLEDRIVKRFLSARAGRDPRGSRHEPGALAVDATGPAPSFHLARMGAVKPRAAEMEANPRARSARLRAATRTSAPVWSAAA